MSVRPDLQSRPPVGLRALLAFALVAVLCLAGWRAFSIAATPVSTTGSALETQITNMLEPVVGKGDVRVSVTYNGDGAKTFTILLNASEAGITPQIRTLAMNASGFDKTAGDKLVFEQAVFDPAFGAAPTQAEWAELGGLAFILAMLGWAFALAGPARQTNTVSEPRRKPLVSEAPKVAQPVTRANLPINETADLVEADPARAAQLLREWMKREDAA